jgi:hypothetical protein
LPVTTESASNSLSYLFFKKITSVGRECMSPTSFGFNFMTLSLLENVCT